MQQDTRYCAAVDVLDERVRRVLRRLPPALQSGVTEVRMRIGQPLSLTLGGQPLFLDQQGMAAKMPQPNSFIVEAADLKNSYVSLCGWAVHSHQKEITQGYIAVKGGHRAGIAGMAVVEDGQMRAVREIGSISLRIAREVLGAADLLVQGQFLDRLRGILIAGPPASGKTTLLRDLARQISIGKTGRYRKVCVVDESGEIGGGIGALQNQLGPCCDLLSGYPKEQGLLTAVRYLSPEVILCDEIATEQEVRAVEMAANTGVTVITSIHAADFEQLSRRPQYQKLVRTGAFERVAVLEGPEKPCEIKMIRRIGNATGNH